RRGRLGQIGDRGVADRESMHTGVAHVELAGWQHGGGSGPCHHHDPSAAGGQVHGHPEVVVSGGVELHVEALGCGLAQPDGQVPVVVVQDDVGTQAAAVVGVGGGGGGQHAG